MAINWNAYDAAKVVIEGKDVANIQDIGSRFPLFSRAVMAAGVGVLPILEALKDYTARKFEMNMKSVVEGAEDVEEVAEEKEEKPEKKAAAKKGRKKAEPVEEEPETDVDEEEAFDSDEAAFDSDEADYESMTGKALYALCCERGLSSKCKKRDKTSLIAVLKAADGENTSADDDEDWDEEEEETDPYEGKKAKDLYMMCKKRGIKCKTGMAADAYVKLLKKADAAEVDEEEDDDEWEV